MTDYFLFARVVVDTADNSVKFGVNHYVALVETQVSKRTCNVPSGTGRPLAFRTPSSKCSALAPGPPTCRARRRRRRRLPSARPPAGGAFGFPHQTFSNDHSNLDPRSLTSPVMFFQILTFQLWISWIPFLQAGPALGRHG